MAKKYTLIDTSVPRPKKPCITNWDFCVLCQEDTGAALECPAKSKRLTVGSGYTSLAKQLLQFQSLGHMPMTVDVKRINDGDGLEATMMRHQACWHKTCRLKFNQTKLDRLNKKLSQDTQDKDSQGIQTRSTQETVDHKDTICIFCDQPSGSEGLHNASTYEIDRRVRQYAVDLQDTVLLAKLAAGDMIAIEAKYHKSCLTALHNRARAAASSTSGNDQHNNLDSIALAELVAYMEDCHNETGIAPVFKLSDLAQLYKTRLEQLGVEVDGRVHTSRLKLRLLAVLPNLKATSQGKNVLLSFDHDIGGAIQKACDHDYYNDCDAMQLVRAAKSVRKQMFLHKYSFDGSFTEENQQNVVPQSLLALVNMILEGPSIKYQSQLINAADKTASNTICQLMVFNSVKNARNTGSSGQKHTYEMPVPLYIAMKVHAVTRSRNLIDTLFNLGICVSYDRFLRLTSDISTALCEQFSNDGVVCPPKLRSSLFTTAAVDNIDYNPSSATAKDSFHGTGISIIQHPSHTLQGHCRGGLLLKQKSTSCSVSTLPPWYTDVPPASIASKEFKVPMVDGFAMPTTFQTLATAQEAEVEWLQTLMAALLKQQLDKTDWISWSAYHASVQVAMVPPSAINTLLPLFVDSAHSVAMIKHSMNIVKTVVQHLNPGQVPVLTADQPLFALAKQIQWTWPDTLGEDHFIVMLGGLHIEMAILKVLRSWLDGSGWINSLVQGNIASTGTADSFINASHVTKTRHAHQVTAACIYILLHHAYDEYKLDASTVSGTDVLSLDEWCELRAQQSVHFQYWLTTFSLEIALLLYIRAIREGNFQLYLESLSKIAPWMFALDHTHYSRWLPVHIRDMSLLSESHPAILAEFLAGKFVVHKTHHMFSAMAIDQCHEQNNATVKDSAGGAIGLMTNPASLRRWMIAGPEIARMVNEFEFLQGQARSCDNKHHEQHLGAQVSFLREVKSLVAVFEEMGNPFIEQGEDLLVLDTRDVLDTSVVEAVRKAEILGEKQYKEFFKERLIKCEKPISDVIPKNKLTLLRYSPAKSLSKQKMQVTALQNDCNLFSRLYISCQTRSGDLDAFFSHENQATPPSLSTGGEIRLGTKADLLECLELEKFQVENAPTVDVKLLDGTAVVQMINPGAVKTFQEYADTVFLPYVFQQLTTVKRVDVVWDEYVLHSLKDVTRQKRGKGIRRRVTSTTKLPKNWRDFLCVNENKTELFSFLSQQIASATTEEGKVIYATSGMSVLSTGDADVTNLSPCSHEEADTRLLLHARDAVQKGHRKVWIRTVDTDVVILAIAMFSQINPDELWLAFGSKLHFRCIPIHEVVKELDPAICKTLPVFHAFTGCDTVSAFGGRGKRTAWNVWKVFPEVTKAFEDLMLMEDDISDQLLSLLERFVVLLYDRTSDLVTVNNARKWLFTQKSRSLENIPPTQEALKQHIKRASYQAHCWNMAVIKLPELPNPAEWGWQKDSTGWHPLWTTLTEASQFCHELIRCGCKKGCTTRCKCVKAALKCTLLCSCLGECERQTMSHS